MRRILFAMSALSACSARPVTPAAPAQPSFAIEAEIWTGDSSRPRGRYVSWRGDRVVEVSATPPTSDVEHITLPPGAFVAPGLVDAHGHMAGLGRSLEQLGLRGDSREAIVEKVRRAHAGRPPGEWIQGRGWDQNLWAPPEFPTRALLDAVAPGRAVWLRRVDGHAAWASSEALRRAGITRDTKDPPGGRILRDAAGEPAGVLVDNAMDLVARVLPEAGPVEIERWLLRAQEHVAERGLTTVHDAGVDPSVEAVYRRLAAERRLIVRVWGMLADGPELERRLGTPPEAPDATSYFQMGGAKLYIDGALGSRGAALLLPYADDPGQSGLLTMEPERLRRLTAAALRTGWQVGVHAIGDRGNRVTLDGYELALRAVPARDPRLRIEHAQILDPADIPRFAALGVMASMQPTHATSDGPWVPARLGPDRLRGAYAWRSLMRSGAHVCAGSDFPVEHADPVLGLHAAVTRQDDKGQPPGGWLPEERISADEALRAFTSEAAYCAKREREAGVLRPGAVADLTVLDRDITTAPPEAIKDARVLLTVVGGRIVYRRP